MSITYKSNTQTGSNFERNNVEMTNTIIKKISDKDVPLLQRISVDTFTETFSDQNDPAHMAKYLAESLSMERLKSELNMEGSLFWLAKADDKVIGYLKVNTGSVQTEQKLDNSLEIERIYVLKEYHGRGVAQQLYEVALQTAKDLHKTHVWLGVWEENYRAIAFYRKLGFTPFDQHIFMLGDDAQTDILMQLELK